LKLAHAGADIIFNGADPKARMETVIDPGKSLQDDAKFGKALVKGFVEPYKKSWAEGKYFEVAGRATFDIGSMFIGAGEANAAIKTGEVASVAAKTAEVANVASKTGEVANVASKTAEVANVASRTGEVANVAGKSGKVVEVASTTGKASEKASKVSRASETSKVAEQISEGTSRIEKASAPKTSSVNDGKLHRVMNQTRNSEPLTELQKAEAVSYAKSLGATDDMIQISNNMNTSYGNMFGRELLYIGSDVLQGTGKVSGITANSRISMKGAIAHELVGHRNAALAGRAFDISTARGLMLEEAQASIRAAKFAPGLTKIERYTLLRDGIARLKKQGVQIKEVRDLLWITEP
jgi:hypothetical protein